MACWSDRALRGETIDCLLSSGAVPVELPPFG